MSSQLTSRSSAENSADLLRVLAALALLALLASFDGAENSGAAATQPASAELAAITPGS